LEQVELAAVRLEALQVLRDQMVTIQYFLQSHPPLAAVAVDLIPTEIMAGLVAAAV
jgi:hypothetical protein